MSEGLSKYNEKRDFRQTPEPPAKPAKGRGGDPVFVVHRHEATRLHYDLRLEMEGVLKSFAVPRLFSFDPKVKRLAVRTEDHPIEYEHFDGVIPKGQYGAGTMTIWDKGTYEVLEGKNDVEALDAGKLELRLHGRRLRGEWHMVKTKRGEGEWLLFKARDRYARGEKDPVFPLDLKDGKRKPVPKRLQAMTPAAESAVFTDAEWIFEMEFLGERLFLKVIDGEVRLKLGRRDLSRKLPELVREAERLRARDVVIDGVLVALDESSRPCRERLAARLAGDDDVAVSFYAFDLLHYEEWDLRGFPLRERKTALTTLLPPDCTTILYVDHVEGKGEELLDVVNQVGLPGLIAKRGASSYTGGESDDWRRIPATGASKKAAGGDLFDDIEQAKPRGKGLRHKIQFTNLKKVFWDEEGYTKGDLIEYYAQMTDFILPYLRNRPMHMKRCPDGIDGKFFYQKDAPDHVPKWIATETVHSESEEGKKIRYIVCNDRETLLYLANLGSIDLHPWLSSCGNLHTPDWCVIDLDPDGTPFPDVVKVARTAGKLLRGIGLRPYLKTSGATGMHIYIPLLPNYTYEQERMFAEGVARYTAREHPDIATVERNVSQRRGKIYVDFLQNRRGQTIVPPYCVRPKPGATVSAPLDWDELSTELHPSLFTIKTMPERAQRLGDLFRGTLTDQQDLLPAIEGLQAAL